MPYRPHALTVLVAGSTGRLGGVVDVLLTRGHPVRAMTRDSGSPASERLRSLGAELVYGDFDDAASLQAAALGSDAVVATGTAHRVGPEGEARHGVALAEAVAEAGAPHMVYISGDGASPESPLPLFRAKYEVEERIRSLGMAHTILAPVYFMENLFNPWNLAALRNRVFPSPVPVDQAMQQVAVEDVIALAALAIEQPVDFANQRIPLASDTVTAEQAADAVSDVTGRTFAAEPLSRDDMPPPLRALFAWLEHVGQAVDVASLRRRYPQVGWHTYPDWAASQTARFRELCQHPSPVA